MIAFFNQSKSKNNRNLKVKLVKIKNPKMTKRGKDQKVKKNNWKS